MLHVIATPIGNLSDLSERALKVLAEVDFVAEKQGVIYYWQVTADMTSESTFEREMRPLRSIADNYSKTVLTLDRFSAGNYEGIQVVNVIDWLSENPTASAGCSHSPHTSKPFILKKRPPVEYQWKTTPV